MKMVRIAAAATFVLQLAGCATNELTSAHNTATHDGYVILGLGAANAVDYADYALKLHAKNGTHETTIVYRRDNLLRATHRDFQNSNSSGFVAVRQLPPGEYEVYAFHAFNPEQINFSGYQSSRTFSVPFTVRSGEATYLGDFIAQSLTQSNAAGISLKQGIGLSVLDNSTRDIPLAEAKAPGFHRPVNIAIPAVTSIGKNA